MTQASRPQADSLSNYPAPSDPGPYSGDQWAELFQILFTGDQQATQGPFVRYLNELEVTDNGSTAVYVDTGAGMVNGHALISSEQETWAIPAGPAGGRTDRVVMVENNTNTEVTQSTAARPLLFPADLSEYTATPGVPPYSARLAILRGNDAGALPALDQTNNLYMVELARYDINNVPTISAATDYREWCLFSSSVGERQFFVPATMAYNVTGGIVAAQDQAQGFTMADAAVTHLVGHYTVPTDFRSGMVVQAVVRPTATANIYSKNETYVGQCGEAWGAHFTNVGYAAVAVANAFNNCIQDLIPGGASVGDVITTVFRRDATNVLDTLNTVAYFPGWLVTYNAKS